MCQQLEADDLKVLDAVPLNDLVRVRVGVRDRVRVRGRVRVPLNDLAITEDGTTHLHRAPG